MEAANLPSPIAAIVKNGSPAQARKVAEDFEAVFVNELLENMSAGVKTDGPFGGGEAEGVYRSLMNDSISKAITARGGLGIADNVYRQIIRMQEEAAHVAR